MVQTQEARNVVYLEDDDALGHDDELALLAATLPVLEQALMDGSLNELLAMMEMTRDLSGDMREFLVY
jgi:hypothetical protein